MTTELVFPSQDDPVVRGASRVAGGPIGDHATLRSGPPITTDPNRGGPRGRGWWTVLRVLLLFAVLTSVAGYASKQPCRDTRNWSKKGYQYTRLCYSDVKALYDSAGLTQGKRPYLDTPLEYPVLLGAAIQGAASVSDHQPGSQYVPAHTDSAGKQVAAHYSLDRRSATFFDVSVLMLALAFCIAVICTALTAGPRIWDAALLALAPGVVLHLGTNWDMLAVAFASAGLLAWSRKRPALAGVLIGLGAATKLYPVLLLLPLLVLCVRAGQLRSWVRAAVATVLTGLVVYLPVYLAAPVFVEKTDGSFQKVPDSSAWHQLVSGQFGDFLHALAPHHSGGLNGTWRFFQLNADRTADWDSIPFAIQHFTHHVFSTSALTVATGAGFLVLFAGITWLGISAPRRPRVGQLAFLTVVAFLLTNKVFSPQYVLWLIPLYVLARPRWWAFLVWQLSEFFLLIMRYSHFVNLQYPTRGVPESWFVGAVCARDLILVALCVLIVWDIWHPEHDVVRATTGRDDPAGGVLDGAPERWQAPAARSAPAGTGLTEPAGPAERTGSGVTALDSERVSAPVRTPGPTMRGALLAVLPVWAATRIAVALLAVAGSRLVTGGQANQVSGFSALWDRWDVQLFWKVARYGYRSPAYTDHTEVDFPGMPLALRVVHLVVRDWVLSGIVISLVASLAACVAFYLLAGGGRQGDGAVLALLVFPYSVFLFAGYSEGLFLAFAAWAWWAARNDRWLLASVLACGATATRVIGIPLLVALFVQYVTSRRAAGRPLLPQLGWLLLPALPLVGFVTYLRARTGRWDAYSEAMRVGWHRDISYPWVAIRNTWSYATDATQPATYMWFWRAELLAVLVGVIVTVLLARERRWGEATFVGASCLLMSSSTYLASGVRAVLVWFPLFLLLGRAFATRPWIRLIYLTLAVPLAAVFVLAFTAGQWVD